MSTFKKVNQQRASEIISKQIEEAIVNGEFQPGDRFPAERELQKKFEVSRNTLREAIRILENKGLVEIKKGNKGGTFVRESNSDQLTESLLQFIRTQKISLEQLSEFRQNIESIVTAKAAYNADSKNIVPILALQDKAESLAAKGSEYWDEFMEVDKQIHFALANLSGNPLYLFFMESIHNNIHYYNISSYLPRTSTVIDNCLESLLKIIAAVKNNNVNLAERLAKEHVDYFNKYMLDTYENSALN